MPNLRSGGHLLGMRWTTPPPPPSKLFFRPPAFLSVIWKRHVWNVHVDDAHCSGHFHYWFHERRLVHFVQVEIVLLFH